MTNVDCVTRDEFKAVVDELDELRDELENEKDRRRELEDDLEEKDERIDELENENRVLRSRVDTVADVSQRIDDGIAELQSRELEKGAHIQVKSVSHPDELEIEGGRLERFQKEDGTYYRLPESDDPLERGGATTLTHADLLPIQQLSKLDEDMIRANVSTIQGRLAVKVWQDRKRDEYGLWRRGSGPVREYFNASDLKSFILAQEDSINEDYAQKLVSRTISALKTFSRDRLGVQKKKRRKDGLRYQERRVVLKNDANIPGETNRGEDADSPGTAGVHGD